MHARMNHPAMILPEAMKALQALNAATENRGVPATTLGLVHLRASQINGCGVCVDMHARDARKSGESEERVWAVAAWRETRYFSDAERAALALTEELTRLPDRAEQVSDEVWEAVSEHFDEVQLGALVLDIATVNLWNRLNIATRQIAGDQSW
jgi:AhpD family alkylhydroperoxidase